MAGGVTAPRGAYLGVSPVDFIRGMGAAHARLDAYAHNPYPLRRFETPSTGGCDHCETITMATIDRLLREVGKAFGPNADLADRVRLPDEPARRPARRLPGAQARYLAEAARRAHATPYVDMLIQYLYQDEPDADRWQSGLLTASGRAKVSRLSAMLPLAQATRSGLRTELWGQVRPGKGTQSYELQQFRNGGWRSVGGLQTTTSRASSHAPCVPGRAPCSASGIPRSGSPARCCA